MKQTSVNYLIDTNVCLDFDKIIFPKKAKLFLCSNVFQELDNLKHKGLSRLVNHFCRKHAPGLSFIDQPPSKLPGDQGILDFIRVCEQRTDKEYTLLTSDVAMHTFALKLGIKSVLAKKHPAYDGRGTEHPNSFLTDESWGSVPNHDKVFHKPVGCYEVPPRNAEQNVLMYFLMNPKVRIVSVAGPAGSGKTLVSLAGALELLESGYEELYVTKPNVALNNKDIGYLPGSVDDKMAPWLQSFDDNLKVILSNGKKGRSLTEYNNFKASGVMQAQPLSFIRGRSLHNCVLIVDEAQNLSFKELVAIVTRMTETSKLILIGDTEQSDLGGDGRGGFLDVIELLKDDEAFAHVSLFECQRSALVQRFLKKLQS